MKVLMSAPLKSSPLDVLPATLRRESADTCAPVLAHMANLSFSQCCFPVNIKMAQVLPPGQDTQQMTSYRPISNLRTVSKVLERLVLNSRSLRPRLFELPCLSRLQSAYRRHHSTEATLLHVMNGIYSALDNKRATTLVALDISSPDAVWRQRRGFKLAAIVYAWSDAVCESRTPFISCYIM
jgi:hypothetical protein